jgi:hypothetical protein
VAEALGLTSDDPTVNEAINALLAVATSVRNGLMSAADKSKLDGVANNANNYVHPTAAGNKHIPSGGSVDSILGYSASGTAIWIQQLAEKSLLSSSLQTAFGAATVEAFLTKLTAPTLLQTYSIAGTYNYTVPSGVRWIFAVIQGAGGGGGAGYSDAAYQSCKGGGGGGAGTVTCVCFPVTSGQIIPIVVGAAGIGGTTNAGDGTAGGTSSVNGVIAQGGGLGKGSGGTNNGGAGGAGTANGGSGGSGAATTPPGGNAGTGSLIASALGLSQLLAFINRLTGQKLGAGGGGGGSASSTDIQPVGGSGGVSDNGNGGAGGNAATGASGAIVNATSGGVGGPGCGGGGGGGGKLKANSHGNGGNGGPGYVALYSVIVPVGI